jgi:glycerol-3-phosphate dehydrogenase
VSGWGPGELQGLRDELAAGTGEPWDLVVVGAGITGAGIARDAALRGLRVLVLEAKDVAFGTSSRSSRLIHGGVRYLEQGEIGLVFEALRERSRLYAAAPHLVRPARFLFPAYADDRLGPWRLRLGLTLYDTLNFHRGQAHEFLGAEDCLVREPLLAADGLRGAVVYEDAITDDARLTLATLLDARRHGARVLTYAPVATIATDGDERVVALEGGTRVRAREVIVAAGPWTTAKLIGSAGEKLLTLSKGIHIVMRREHVPVAAPVVVQAPKQRRILFVVPWGERTYLGTTDAPYTGDPGRSGVTEADELELLALVGRVLPRAELRAENIVSAWSGVRPLVRAAGRHDTVELSRKHRIVETDAGALAIVGGKLTTYRAMAEEIVDRVVDRLLLRWPEARERPRRCETHRLPLVPGAALEADELADPLIADLAPRHGPLARELARACAGDPSAAQRMIADLPYRWCEVDHAIAHEGVTHVVDLLRRRLPLALTDADLGGRVAAAVARKLADAWGDGDARVREELERYREEIAMETRRVPRV